LKSNHPNLNEIYEHDTKEEKDAAYEVYEKLISWYDGGQYWD